MGSKIDIDDVPEQTGGLPDHIKAFIVTRLAIFHDYEEIKEECAERFGVKPKSIDLTFLNPRTKSGADRISEEHLKLYTETQDAFRRGLIDVGIMYKAYRLRRLDQMERSARKAGKFGLARELLRQAAEEAGGVFDKQKNGLDLELLRDYVDKLALAVVQNVKDPTALKKIEEAWGNLDGDGDSVSNRVRASWGV